LDRKGGRKPPPIIIISLKVSRHLFMNSIVILKLKGEEDFGCLYTCLPYLFVYLFLKKQRENHSFFDCLKDIVD
jgi:hypothetical protein